MSGLEVTYLILSIICLIISFLGTSAEVAFINLPKLRVEHLVRTNVRHAKTVADIKNNMERFLSTTSFINAIADTIVAALGSALFVIALGRTAGNPVGIAIIAFLMFIFARVVPKLIAAQHAERMALLYAGPVKFIITLLSRVVRIASWVPIRIAGLFGQASLEAAASISKEEIGSIISVGEKEGVVRQDEAQILQKAVKFGERDVYEVMTPRTELTWIERSSKLSDFFPKYADNPSLRYPVYEDTYDNIIGYLSIRDVVLAQAQSGLSPDYALEQLYRPVYRVPGDKRIGELFTEMRAGGHQMAAIISEYGGTSGIINIERLAEEIVGELGEELAEEEQFEAVGECSFQIDGNMRIEDVKDELGLEIPEGEYQTMAGFALSVIGHFPADGEQVTHTPEEDEQVNYSSITLLVKKVEENRIKKLLVSWEPKEETPSEGEAPSKEESPSKKNDLSKEEAAPKK